MLYPPNEFELLAQVFEKHFIVSFANGEMAELDFDDLMRLGFEIGKVLREYQILYCTHVDSDHTHIHFVMNTVSFLDGRKYSDGLVGFLRVKQFLEIGRAHV